MKVKGKSKSNAWESARTPVACKCVCCRCVDVNKMSKDIPVLSVAM